MASPAKAAPDYLLEFDPAEHIYYVDGVAKPSTTQVLKLGGVVDDTWYDEACRWRGSWVHAVTADIDAHALQPNSNSADFKMYAPYVQAWEKFKLEKKFHPTLVEHRLYDRLLDTCGTLDRVGFFEGGPANVLIDLKTSKSGIIPKWVRLQTASYGHGLDPTAIWRRMAVILMPDGTYRLEPHPVEEYQKHVADFAALARAVQVRREYGN